MVRPLIHAAGLRLSSSLSLIASRPGPPRDRCRPMDDPTASPGQRPETPPESRGRVLIVGDRRDSRRVARRLSQGTWTGMTVVGFVDAGHNHQPRLRHRRHMAVHPQADPVPVLGRVDHLERWVDRVKATHLVVALTGRRARRLRSRLAEMDRSDVRIHWLPNEHWTSLEPSAEVALKARPPWRWRWDRMAKRAVDFAGALFGLCVLSPLFAVIAAIIWMTDGRPIFYTQDRVGQGGRIFPIYKFRSMRRDAESVTGPIWATNQDDRCTRIGLWLRRTNIDELPQLWNVLRGQMSLVGPRPERPIFVERFQAGLPDYNLRHSVPVGMTGWAQVHGWRGRTSLRKRLQYDLDYIQRWSFLLDFRVLFMTYQHITQGRTSWAAPKRPSGS